jgi:hypothetical protein
LESCIKNNPDLISGDDFPDAFYFGSFIGGSNCSTFRAFHDNAFATQLMLSAKAEDSSAGFNATAFSLGYASHMYADDVGFFSTTLTPESTYLNWLKVWTYMVSIDAYTLNQAGITTGGGNTDQAGQLRIVVPTLPRAGSEFVAKVAGVYKANVNPQAPVITADQVGYCAAAWEQVLRDKTDEAMSTLTATWRHQLVEFSAFNATTWQEAVKQLEPSQNCVADVWRYYLTLVNEPGAKPGVVDSKALAYIQDAYAKGKCTPHTIPSNEEQLGPMGRWPEAG